MWNWLIGDFRVAFRLCFKASLSTKSFIWKLVLFTCKWPNLHVNKTNFHKKGFALGLALKQRRNATRKSPITQSMDSSHACCYTALSRKSKNKHVSRKSTLSTLKIPDCIASWMPIFCIADLVACKGTSAAAAKYPAKLYTVQLYFFWWDWTPKQTTKQDR